MPDRLKRIFAFFIDWNILYLPALLIAFPLSYVATNSELVLLTIFVMLILILGTYALIAARDIIFGGRSLGKRIFGLYVVDKKTLEPISAGRRFVRNIFFCLINWLEIILLLATGETLGDRVASAAVLSRRSLEQKREAMKMAEQGCEAEQALSVPAATPVNTATPSRKPLSSKVLLPLIFGITVLCIVAFIGLIQIVLHTNRDTPQAQVAYEYVLSSDAFATAGLEPDELRMNEFSVSYVTENGEMTATTEITFTAHRGLFCRYAFYVTCHKEGETWVVCDDCTRITVSGVKQ